MLKKILITVLIVVVVLIAGFAGFVQATYDKNYDEEYPVADLKVEADFAMIERGRYLVYGPAHCSHCHVPFEKLEEVEAGKEVPLTGGFDLEIPPGTFHAPNITPDPETGIGNLSDGELYRMLRYNINHNGRACVDFMPFVNMSEEDIHSVIAYLRAQEPVKNASPETEYTFLGKMVHVMGAIKPGLPEKPVPQKARKEPTAEYGSYLAYSVANCRGCHTNRNIQTGEYIGEEYAGGFKMGPDNTTGGYAFISPNLTPDPETGVMADWDFETFKMRMRKGRLHKNSPMPWGSFAQTDDTDLKALYEFFQSLEPVKNEIAQTVIAPEDVE